jgi:preprotein translocase subunit SecE
VATVAEGTQVSEASAGTPAADKAAVTTSGKNGTASATSRPRQGSKAQASAAPPSAWQRVINTDRFAGLQKFIRDAWAEIKKVIWPDRETTRNLTLVVIAVSVVLGILLGGIDYVLFQLFEALP